MACLSLEKTRGWRRLGVTRLTLLTISFSLILTGVGFAEADPLERSAQKSAKAASSLLMDVVNTGKRLVAVGERGHILYSDDHGKSWLQAEVPTSATLTAVFFPTPNKGWAVGHYGVVLHSSDGGKSWSKQLDGNQINQMNLALLEKLIIEKQTQLDSSSAEEKEALELELESLDFFLGDVQAAVSEGPTLPLTDVWFRNEQEGFVVGSFGIALQTLDGGEHWTPLLDRLDNPDGFHYYGISRSGDSLYFAGEVGMVLRSDDFGQSWQRLSLPYDGTLFGVIGHPESNSVVVFGLRGNAYNSTDNGLSWRKAETGITSSIGGAAFLKDGTLWAVANDGSIIRSRDKGVRFELLPERFGASLSLADAGNGEVVIVGLRGMMQTATDQ